MEVGFQKGQSDNLPKIDSMMLAVFYRESTDFTTAEIRGVKAQRSARDSYGDNAIGYVQVKRDGDLCTVKSRITPEHKVNSKPYKLCALVDEKAGTIVSVACEGCAAGLGGCKHAIAFLAWLHRRSEDAPVTSVRCYWKKASLSNVGKTTLLKASDMGRKRARALPATDGSSRDEFLELCKKQNVSCTQLTSYHVALPDEDKLSIHHLMAEFKNFAIDQTSDDFNVFAKSKITAELCKTIETATSLQCDSVLWHELRFGRITASKLYAAAHCHTFDGSLVERILGAKFKTTKAMERGVKLEGSVRKALANKLKTKIRQCGLLLNKDYPVFGASPDGIGDNFIVEIKCPSSSETRKGYFKNDGNDPAEKHYAQMQLQMLFAGKATGVFCVADVEFEETKGFTEIWVDLNPEYSKLIICKAFQFWSKAVFPKLISQ